jgi:hypothetical protein
MYAACVCLRGGLAGWMIKGKGGGGLMHLGARRQQSQFQTSDVGTCCVEYGFQDWGGGGGDAMVGRGGGVQRQRQQKKQQRHET